MEAICLQIVVEPSLAPQLVGEHEVFVWRAQWLVSYGVKPPEGFFRQLFWPFKRGGA